MYFEQDGTIYASSDALAYPHLNKLLMSYFHQDFDIFGDTLAEIVGVYRDDFPPEDRAAMVGEIQRFLEVHGPSEGSIMQALDRILKPDIIIEGWEGLNAKEWLQRIAQLAANPLE
jgi:hypothetical protein